MTNAPELPPEIKARMRAFLSLTRYFAWSEVMRRDVFRYDRMEEIEKEKADAYFDSEAFAGGAYIAYWYSALYVVVEGWEELGLSHPDINQHLDNPHKDVLRRFRNGVFHFQRNWQDDRFLVFIDDVEGAHRWAVRLASLFESFFRTWEADVSVMNEWLWAT